MCGIFFYLGRNPIKSKDKNKLETLSKKLTHRGPDEYLSRYYNSNVMCGFHRLAIVDTISGMQPFETERYVCMVNGEIYNYKELTIKYDLIVNFRSDCEVVIPLFLKFDKNISKLCDTLDGEFAFVIYDTLHNKVFFGVDEIRTRPLFLGVNENEFIISSEQKSLITCQDIIPIPSGHHGVIENMTYRFFKYYEFIKPVISVESPHLILKNLLTNNVKKKLSYERDSGFLLSGGLDSSLVCGIASSLSYPNKIRTFTVGFDENATDVVAARNVAKHIDSIHTEFIFTYKEGLDMLKSVIYANESWDQTTTRASIPMSLMCREIKKKHPEMAIIFSGELSDEIFMGYLEWIKSPSLAESKEHLIRRVRDVTYFDGLRADRTITSYGMELRLPFFSRELLDFVLSLDPKLLDPKYNDGMEKYLLRRAFSDNEYIPDDILWRKKMALSDATSIVGATSWKEKLKSFADREIADSRFNARELLYPNNTPQTKEDMLYREIFEEYTFNDECIPYKWLPNWSEGQTDSSATELEEFNNDIIY